jgi:hypothetical protein
LLGERNEVDARSLKHLQGARSSSETDRANRSNFRTATASKRLRWASAISRAPLGTAIPAARLLRLRLECS